MKRRKPRGKKLIWVAALVVAAAAAWCFWPRGPKDRPEETTKRTPRPQTQPKDRGGISTREPKLKAPGSNERGTPTISSGDVLKCYDAGKAAFDNQPLLARAMLSKALFSNKLPTEWADDARSRLTYLARRTLLDPAAAFNPGKDPYTRKYTFQSGETITRIERRVGLHVPPQLILKINDLTSAKQFQAGRTYKLIKGPFHAIVYKSKFVMDVYLHRRQDNLPKVFIKRYRVGLGASGNTPVGRWRLGCGADGETGKAIHPRWYPPPNSEQTTPLSYGQPGYPFGARGLWIGLMGLDEYTKSITGFGIHSTDKPNSIGKEASLGCIRLGDDDIEELYSMLYEFWSTVEVRP